jgi:hypothetical protein
MSTDLCRRLDIGVPIFALRHCRDVVVEVSKSGGLGVHGAVGYTPEQLKVELDWIDRAQKSSEVIRDLLTDDVDAVDRKNLVLAEDRE